MRQWYYLIDETKTLLDEAEADNVSVEISQEVNSKLEEMQTILTKKKRLGHKTSLIKMENEYNALEFRWLNISQS